MICNAAAGVAGAMPGMQAATPQTQFAEPDPPAVQERPQAPFAVATKGQHQLASQGQASPAHSPASPTRRVASPSSPRSPRLRGSGSFRAAACPRTASEAAQPPAATSGQAVVVDALPQSHVQQPPAIQPSSVGDVTAPTEAEPMAIDQEGQTEAKTGAHIIPAPSTCIAVTLGRMLFVHQACTNCTAFAPPIGHIHLLQGKAAGC